MLGCPFHREDSPSPVSNAIPRFVAVARKVPTHRYRGREDRRLGFGLHRPRSLPIVRQALFKLCGQIFLPPFYFPFKPPLHEEEKKGGGKKGDGKKEKGLVVISPRIGEEKGGGGGGGVQGREA